MQRLLLSSAGFNSWGEKGVKKTEGGQNHPHLFFLISRRIADQLHSSTEDHTNVLIALRLGLDAGGLHSLTWLKYQFQTERFRMPPMIKQGCIHAAVFCPPWLGHAVPPPLRLMWSTAWLVGAPSDFYWKKISATHVSWSGDSRKRLGLPPLPGRSTFAQLTKQQVPVVPPCRWWGPSGGRTHIPVFLAASSS